MKSTNNHTVLSDNLQYEELQIDEFRVLDLLAGSFEDAIRCQLRREPLPGNREQVGTPQTPYEALSYVWGSAVDKVTIECSHGVLDITRNLFSALKHLRLPNKTRCLWVDAICINQSDIPERNSQVKQMGRIYANSEKTLVYLGEETEDVKGILQMLAEFLSTRSPLFASRGSASVEWVSNTMFSFKEENLSEEIVQGFRYQQRYLLQVLNLFARPWWRRRWIIQEIILAKEAILICGFATIRWAVLEPLLGAASFFDLNRDLMAIYTYHPDKTFIESADSGLWNANQLARMSLDYQKDDRWNLQSLVGNTRRFLCTDPRDTLYSLLAIAQDVDTKNLGPLQVDYADSVESISKRYCLWCIKNVSKQLYHFSQVCGTRSRCSVTQADVQPSWVWSLDSIRNPARLDINLAISGLDFDAASFLGDVRPILGTSSHENLLSLHGRITEEIVKLVPPPPVVREGEASYIMYKDIPSWIKTCWDVVKVQANKSDDFLEFFCEFFTCGGDDAHEKDETWKSPSLEACQKFLDEMLHRDSESTDAAKPSVDPEIAAFEDTLRFVQYRKLCVTSKGRLGWVPPIAELGDKVCLLYGAIVPFVITECGNGHFNLVGECYIHGIMYREGLKGSAEVDQMIELC